MLLIKKSEELQNTLQEKKSTGNSIGFVPTMGALHAGHTSLIAASRQENSLTTASVFVNPAQFNDPKDFKRYPITIEKDIYNLEASFCDILFYPPVDEIYTPDGPQLPNHDLGSLDTILEGKYRPGHFQGVCRAMHRLLEIVRPDNLYLGQKDYQQCMVIKKLIELTGPSNSITIKICPTVREPDGLAMSSRNMLLNTEERKQAVGIYRVLEFIKQNLKPGDTQELISEARKMLLQYGFKTDYIVIADPLSLAPVQNWDGEQRLIGLIAAYMNEVRLIDNLFLQ